jgi:hypothetical protein
VEYFLFMAVMMVLTSKRVEKRPGATPSVFPPPIFTGIVSVSMFRVSSLPPTAIVERGSIYRHFLGKDERQETKMDVIRARLK